MDLELPAPLPDLVIHRIFQILPTKSAVRLSLLSHNWDGVWSSAPILDFDEGDEPGMYDNDHIDLNKLLEHRDFINIVERWLKFCEKNQQTQVLDKFRLRVMRYVFRDYGIIDKCLSSVFERSVKELDISIRISRLFWGFAWEIHWETPLEFYYCISSATLVNAKTLTVLKLEHLRIKDFHSSEHPNTKLLPNLKTLCLKSVYFDVHAFSNLICECPSIQDLSLTACLIEYISRIEFSELLSIKSSSLKSLEIEHCYSRVIVVDEVPNLESFTVLSNTSQLKTINLKGSSNLKYINVHASHLKHLVVNGCDDCLKATINTPNLFRFSFTGFLKCKVLISAPNLVTAEIHLWELLDGDVLGFTGPFRHFPTLRDFLENFALLNHIVLYVRDFKVILFPKDFRKNFSSPLHGVKRLTLMTSILPKKVRDKNDLDDAMSWIAPSENLHPKSYLVVQMESASPSSVQQSPGPLICGTQFAGQKGTNHL